MSATALRSFEDDIALLSAVLDDVCRAGNGVEILELRRRAVELAGRARAGEQAAGDELERMIAGLDLGRIDLLIRSLTRWFQLINLAEDNERVRRIRAHEARVRPHPRAGSLRDAVAQLAGAGHTAAEVRELLAGAEVRLVMTAHPTEARRRTTIDKQARIFRELRSLDEQLGADEIASRDRIRATVQELWGSDELRAISLGVEDEVRGGLVHFSSTLTDAAPAIYRDLEGALTESFPDEQLPVAPLLRFGSWIGGDRDGNPFVTAEATETTLELLREQCLRFLERRVGLIAGRLSLSARLCGSAPMLAPLLATGRELFPALARRLEELNPEEPYRRALTFMRERVRATAADQAGGYDTPDQLVCDLRIVERSLLQDAGAYTARAGDLHDVIRQVEVFGFHYVKLDIRQHARVHRDALGEVLAQMQLDDRYQQLDDPQRCVLLERLIEDQRPLIPADLAGFTDTARETIGTFRMIAGALAGRHPGTIDAYVISGAEGPADVLEVLLLMKEANLAIPGGALAALRIVPLFESGESLKASPRVIEALLRTASYRRALAAVGDEQEIMVGYSDSNKDVGYVASGWLAYRAQQENASVLKAHGLSWRFFHGRGGAIGRGGGRTADAILALPPGTVRGRLKMTEQGEVLNAKYTVREIAQRELELAVGAILLSAKTAEPTDVGPGTLSLYQTVIEEMAQTSQDVYHEVVHQDPDFIDFFLRVTPVEEVSRLRLGSRPPRRSAAGGIDELRAIPWVFSWTQARIILPAWLGLGTALRGARNAHGLQTLRQMLSDWPFFAALVANAEMACAKADMGIARRYVALWEDDARRVRIWDRLEQEYELARAELIGIRGGSRLLDAEPTLQSQIDRRNPSVDPLSFIQVELLRRRLRTTSEDAERDQLDRLGLSVINGIASGLRNTG